MPVSGLELLCDLTSSAPSEPVGTEAASFEPVLSLNPKFPKPKTLNPTSGLVRPASPVLGLGVGGAPLGPFARDVYLSG